MAFFDDFATAVSNYPATNINLSIINVGVAAGDAAAFNVTDTLFGFLKVANNGNLNLTNVIIHVSGLSRTIVGAGPTLSAMTPNYISTPVNINAHSSILLPFFFKPGSAGSNVQLVKAHIETFDVNLNHILIDHSGPADPPAAIYTTQVYP